MGSGQLVQTSVRALGSKWDEEHWVGELGSGNEKVGLSQGS